MDFLFLLFSVGLVGGFLVGLNECDVNISDNRKTFQRLGLGFIAGSLAGKISGYIERNLMKV